MVYFRYTLILPCPLHMSVASGLFPQGHCFPTFPPSPWRSPKHNCLCPKEHLLMGPCLGARVRFLSFNRTQSRVITGLFTGHNILRSHLHLMGLSDSPLCRRCGAEGEISAHILCECEALASFRRVSGLLLLGARGH